MVRLRALRLVAPFLIVIPARAQRTWPDAAPQRTLSIDYNRAFQKDFETPFGTAHVNPGSYAFTLEGRAAVSDHADVTIELPFTHLNETYPGFALQATKLGNPWLGFESVGTGWLTVQGGIRIGLSKADSANEIEAMHSATLADYDHFRGLDSLQVLVREWPSSLAEFRLEDSSRNRAGRWVGVMLPVEAFEDKQVALTYGVRGGLVMAGVQASAAYTGRYLASGTVEVENTVGLATLSVQLVSGRIRPHVEYRMFQNQGYKDETTGVVNFGLTVVH